MRGDGFRTAEQQASARRDTVKVDVELYELKAAAAAWVASPDQLRERQLCEAAVTFSEAVKRALKAQEEPLLNQWRREDKHG